MTRKLSNQRCDIEEAASLLKQGKLVAMPTETVYGIGALLYNKDAVEQLYVVKKRPSIKPCTAHIHSLMQIEELAIALPKAFYALSEAFFPGPLTIIVKKNPNVPNFSIEGDTIGIRMPDHSLTLELLRLVGEPVIMSSANISSLPPATTAKEVLHDFDGLLAAVIDGGPSMLQISSTVVAFDEAERLHIVREGSLSKTMLEKVCPIC